MGRLLLPPKPRQTLLPALLLVPMVPPPLLLLSPPPSSPLASSSSESWLCVCVCVFAVWLIPFSFLLPFFPLTILNQPLQQPAVTVECVCVSSLSSLATIVELALLA